MVPILSTSSSTTEYFIDYPFISDLDVNSIYNTLNDITSTPIKELKEILIDTSLRLKHMNNKNIKNEYYNFLNNL